MHRICVKGNDVILIYYNVTDTCNKFVSLIIYARENKFDTYKAIDTVNNSALTDYIHFNAINKGTTWQYFVKLIRDCPGKDSTYSDTMAIDLTKPNQIEIDSVTVKNGKTEIGWKAAVSKDTKGYVIYYEDVGGNIGIIDTVYGIFNTTYRDNKTGDPDTKIEKYRIAPIDSCDNLTVMSKDHNTILHNSVQDTCKEEITFSWNKYSRWTDSQTDYSIYYSKNGGTYTLLHKMQNSNTSYSTKGFENNSKYCFYIRAFNRDSNFSSTSNITCINTNFIDKPEYIYLKNVSVENNQLEVSWAIDKVSQIRDFKVYRNKAEGPFSLFQTIAYNNNTDFMLIDDTADFNAYRYRYYVEATDVCSNPSIKSNEGGNILLQNEQISDYYLLRWNRYDYWAGGIGRQTLYIKKEDDLTWSFLDNPPLTDDQYNKNLKLTDLKGIEACFYIENAEGDTNKYGYKELSKSNISCISGLPIVYIPNAFYPKGINSHFRPEGKNIDSTQTEIRIFNRWGQLIWNSFGITQGWNGADNGNQIQPAGVYYYFITIIGKDKSKHDYKGNVPLIR